MNSLVLLNETYHKKCPSRNGIIEALTRVKIVIEAVAIEGPGESHTEVIAKFKCLISMSSNMLHRFIKPFLSPTIKFSFKGQKHENQEGRLKEQIFKINGRICETFDLCKSLGLLNLARKQQHYTPFT